MDQKHFENFETLISKWKNTYQWYTCTYLAFKIEGETHLIFCRMILAPYKSNITDSFEFETEHILAGFAQIKIEKDTISSIIKNASDGKVTLPDHIFFLYSDKQNQNRYSSYYSPLHHPALMEGPRQPSIIITGGQKWQLTNKIGRELDMELKAADVPFHDLEDLLMHCGLSGERQMGDLAALEIIARAPTYISNTSKMSRSQAVVECIAAKELDLKSLKIGYKIFHQDRQSERGCEYGDKLEWQSVDDSKNGILKIETGDAPIIQTFLSYQNILLHEMWTKDETKILNSLLAIHETFDADSEILRKILFESTDKYAFEGAVSMLLNLLGFSVSNYGRIPKVQKGPDIIVVTPAGHIGVIECTIGILKEDHKLANLVQRSTVIKEKLDLSGHSYVKIQPILITRLTRNEVAAELKSAGEHNIAVICKEDLEELLNQTGLIPNPEKWLNDSNRFIPNVEGNPLFHEGLQ